MFVCCVVLDLTLRALAVSCVVFCALAGDPALAAVAAARAAAQSDTNFFLKDFLRSASRIYEHHALHIFRESPGTFLVAGNDDTLVAGTTGARRIGRRGPAPRSRTVSPAPGRPAPAMLAV